MIVETRQGSATSPRPTLQTDTADTVDARGVIIAHIVNSVGAWGRGFVLAVDKLSPIPRKAYKEMAQRHGGNIPLGETQFCEVEPNLWVANMVAQKGIDKSVDADGVLVDYKALNECLKLVFARSVLLGCDVHVPSGMGSGLAGGDEQMIHSMIETRATCTPLELLERQMKFRPRISLWEFDDKTAASYITTTGALTKPTASPQAIASSVDAAIDIDDLDAMMETL